MSMLGHHAKSADLRGNSGRWHTIYFNNTTPKHGRFGNTRNTQIWLGQTRQSGLAEYR